MERIRRNPKMAKKLVPPLLNVTIEPTNACNLNCEFCSNTNPKLFRRRKIGYISLDFYRSLVKQLDQFKYKIGLGLSFGGEPLLHPDFIPMLEMVLGKGYRIGLNTNAVLLNREVSDALVKAKVNSVTIGLGGIGKKHDEVRKGSHFEEVVSNIKYLIKKRGSSKYPLIHCTLTISDHTDEEISDFKKFWSGKVDNVVVGPCTLEDLSGVRFEERFEMDVNFTSNRLGFCAEPFNYMAILHDGNVTICCSDLQGINSLPFNLKKDSIIKIWKSETYKDLRFRIANRNPIGLCKGCTVWMSRKLPTEATRTAC
jgi:pyruvate-formate lyase-activating enzyme